MLLAYAPEQANAQYGVSVGFGMGVGFGNNVPFYSYGAHAWVQGANIRGGYGPGFRPSRQALYDQGGITGWYDPTTGQYQGYGETPDGQRYFLPRPPQTQPRQLQQNPGPAEPAPGPAYTPPPMPNPPAAGNNVPRPQDRGVIAGRYVPQTQVMHTKR